MGILDEAARTALYSADEVHALAFAGLPPDPADLSRRWHAILAAARVIPDVLPPAEVGRCVLDSEGGPWRGGARELRAALGRSQLIFHAGQIRGAAPQLKHAC